MIRRGFTILSALSLMLCVATCVLWKRSYRVQDEPTFAWPGHMFLQLTSRHGELSLDAAENWPEDCRRWYTGSPDDHFGPLYVPSTGMYIKSQRAGVTVIAGSFSIATSKGRVLMQGDVDDFPALRGPRTIGRFGGASI